MQFFGTSARIASVVSALIAMSGCTSDPRTAILSISISGEGCSGRQEIQLYKPDGRPIKVQEGLEGIQGTLASRPASCPDQVNYAFEAERLVVTLRDTPHLVGKDRSLVAGLELRPYAFDPKVKIVKLNNWEATTIDVVSITVSIPDPDGEIVRTGVAANQ